MSASFKPAAEPSLLKQAFLAVQEMQAKLEAAERRGTEPIAIIGLSCRIPGRVVDGESFWQLLREGRDAIVRVPQDRWDADAYYDPDPDTPGKMVTRWGGFLESVDTFDAKFFEMSPREAASMDPQQRLALEVVWETIENAGIAPASLAGTKTGIFLGIASSDYSQLHMEAGDPELLDAHYASGVAHSIASGRISYLLGLEGPSVSLDTACSSSLVAVHLACQSLRAGDSTMALAGGVNIMLAPETTALLSRVRMLSPGGRCKAFDDSADGFVRGEGCGFVALKTLSRAEADGDRILAVIRGSAVNQDGASSSLTAPNGPSQVSLMREALRSARIEPKDVSYVEAHGTGTALGDPIELQALGAVYGAARPADRPLPVTSLKTNVGHLEAAAGVTGLIKTVLAIEHGEIPPHLNLSRPTTHVPWEQLRLTVPCQATAWDPAGERVAAVSSFGFSGTNAHVIVSAAAARKTERRETGWPAQILAVSAKSQTALAALVREYDGFFEQHPQADLRDVCCTANTGRSHFPWRASFVAADVEGMREQLHTFVPPAAAAPAEPRIGFLFTGQGSQYAGMGLALYAGSEVFHAAMERVSAAWEKETGESLTKLLYGEDAEQKLKQARVAQPALFAVEYALSELWRSWGVEPGVVLGHSLGEYAAAVVAGIFSVEDGLKLVRTRARLMDTLEAKGAMRSVSAPVERVRAAIAGYEKEVAIAVVNGRESVVISGAAGAVEEIAQKLAAEGVRTRALEVTHGFHSPLLEPILDEFERVAGEVKYSAPRMRMVSNRTGALARPGEMERARYWREQMRGTVEFGAGLETAIESGCGVWVEIGPQPHLTALAKSAPGGAQAAWLPSLRKGKNAWEPMLQAVQALYAVGVEFDWKAFHAGSGHRIALPTYPFERQRYWIPKTAKKRLPAQQQAGGHPLLGRRIESPLAPVQFQATIGPGQPEFLEEHAVAGHRVMPAAAYLEMALSAGQALDGSAVEVREVAFLRPCIFDEPRVLQCVVEGGEAARTFAIYSRGENSAEEWALHASGALAAKSEAGRAVSLDAIRDRCREEVDGASFYKMFLSSGVDFGPSFRPVSRVWRGTGEVLVEFHPPTEWASGSYAIHPAALDGCFQAVVALHLLGAETSGVYLPAALESLRLHGDPHRLAAAHAEVRPTADGFAADVQGLDAAGNVLVEALGLLLRPAPRERGTTDEIADWLYQVEWRPVPVDSAAPLHFQGSCVLVGEAAPGFVAALEQGGVQQVPAVEGLADAIRNSTVPVTDVFYFAAPTRGDLLRSSPDRLMEIEAELLGGCMLATQTLLASDTMKTPRLWIVTRGAVGPGLADIAASTLFGFGRSLAAEHPEMRVVRLDLDPASEAAAGDVLRLCEAAAEEDELVLRGREIFAPRLRRLANEDPVSATNGDSNLRLELRQPGTLERIETVATTRRSPGPGEIEIEVAAAGMNFRDVLTVLGMYRGKSGPLGGECAGIVVRVGEGVKSLAPGDEVVALGPGCFAQFMVARAEMVWPKPRNLSFAAAVTIPIAFLTAWHALKTLAQIQPGKRVLIHAAAGGVGLAAVQIARRAGAVVYATAGSAEKRQYLRSLGVEHVMDSRSADFARELLAGTDGAGVDVVLNSLAGELIDAGMRALAPGGRFIEMGVADIRSSESVAAVRPDIAYHPFNLAPALEAGDEELRAALTQIFKEFEAGRLEPLPREIFPLARAQEAFRFMAQARHIGRVVIGPESKPAPAIRRDGAYLVTGGLSGIGLEVARWLQEKGAGQVIVLGRRAADAEAEKIFAEMRDAGTRVRMYRGDVAREVDVQAALDLGELPLRGIFHCAGVFEDGTLEQQSWERFQNVLAPKVAGAMNLHRLTVDRPLDHFVLFSSIASVFGSPGQTNYGAANAFLDALARYRRAHGVAGLSINWGAWSETGAAVRHGTVERGAGIGMGSISTRSGMKALETLLSKSAAQVMVSPMNWAAYFERASPQATRPLLQELRPGSRAAASGDRKAAEARGQQKSSSWVPQLAEGNPARRRDLLMRLLEQRVARTLGLNEGQAIDPEQPLQELGLDSLLSIELRNALSAALERSLPATLLFNYPTLAALGGFILRETGSSENSAAMAAALPSAAPAQLVDDIEALSDEEVERMLNEKTMGAVR